MLPKGGSGDTMQHTGICPGSERAISEVSEKDEDKDSRIVYGHDWSTPKGGDKAAQSGKWSLDSGGDRSSREQEARTPTAI